MGLVHRPRTAAVVAGLVFALVAAITVYDLPGVRPAYTFDTVVDGWLQGACFVLAAVLCLLRAARRDEDAWLWGWIGLALSTRAAGFVVYLAWVRRQDPVPYPSVADLFWLLTPLFMLVGLVLLARREFRGLSTGMALDGVAAALAAGAVTLALIGDTLVTRAEAAGGQAVVLTNLAYPLTDFALLLVLTAVLVAYRWQPPLAVWALLLGTLGFVVVDIVFLVQVTAGTWRPGTLLGPFTLLVNALIAVSGFLPSRPVEHREALPGLVAPVAVATTCLGVLLYAAFSPLSRVAVALAALGLLVVIVRTGLSFRSVRQVAADRRLARTDELTGLPNRRAFHERFTNLLHDRPETDLAALLIVDLDDFKAVNDRLGHHHGDRVLATSARRLEDALRGDLLARMSGDEFAVLLDGAGAEVAAEVAGRLARAVRQPVPVDGGAVEVTASVGVAVFPTDGRDVGELLQHADLAMYEAKLTRPGAGPHAPGPRPPERVRLGSVERIRRAIEGDEMVLHYQPVVDLGAGDVIGFEALCRWQDPAVGMVPPGAFLPLAERGGLMRLLTLNVLDQAARQAAEWRERGHDVGVAVNLSVTNLLDVAFPDQVAMLLETTGLPGSSLELELTEDLFMADPDRARGVIRDLRRLDVSLTVDDYGTGYSSLAYLRDLHEIAGLKIDRSFVTHLVDDPRASTIVESTVALARSLGLRVVAEGVETPAVRDRLVDVGCDLAQGYLFARPAPASVLRFGDIGEARAGGAR